MVFKIKCGSSVGAYDGAVMFLETNPVCEAFGGPDDVGGSIGGDVDGGFGFGLGLLCCLALDDDGAISPLFSRAAAVRASSA